MRVIVIEPNEGQIHAHDTEGNLHDLQGLVGGYIEAAAPAQLREQGIELLVNEEGLLMMLPVNLNMFPFFFLGTAVMVGVDGGEFTGLTEEQQQYAMKWLRELEG